MGFIGGGYYGQQYEEILVHRRHRIADKATTTLGHAALESDITITLILCHYSIITLVFLVLLALRIPVVTF